MHVYQHASGLAVAAEAMDERTVAAELRRIDDRYRLAYDLTPEGRLAWRVVCYLGSERPVAHVASWLDDAGEPLPLSSGLVEKVARLRADSRWREPDPATLNDQLVERARREFSDEIDEAARENAARARRSPAIHRSRSLYLARTRGRKKGLSR